MYEEDISGDIRGMIIKSMEIQSEKRKEILSKERSESVTWKECHQEVSKKIFKEIIAKLKSLKETLGNKKFDFNVKYADGELLTLQFENGYVLEVSKGSLDTYEVSLISSDAHLVYESYVDSYSDLINVVSKYV